MGEAGYVWIMLGQPERAKVVFDGLVALTPDDPSGWLGLARVAIDCEDWKKAESNAAEATRRPYTSPGTAALGYMFRARAALGMGKPKVAVRYLKTVTELEPAGALGSEARLLMQRIGSIGDPGMA